MTGGWIDACAECWHCGWITRASEGMGHAAALEALAHEAEAHRAVTGHGVTVDLKLHLPADTRKMSCNDMGDLAAAGWGPEVGEGAYHFKGEK